MTRPLRLLAIETSCDETAAAVIESPARVLSSVVATQAELHARFGGVVPEIASRAHLELVNPVIAGALADAQLTMDDLDAVAACNGPGLAGALLVGVTAAKTLALTYDIPYVGVHHHEAHLFAARLEHADLADSFLALIVSGGHTMMVLVEAPGRYRLIGRTVDDAAGEAFDKVARHLGLGYPGGPVIDRIAEGRDERLVRFTRPMPEGDDFSFSGIKTAVVRLTREQPDLDVADVAAGFQAAVVDVLVDKTVRAATREGVGTIVLGGGVGANRRLRSQLARRGEAAGLRVVVPDRAWCTDNAAMIGVAAHFRLGVDGPTPLDDGAQPARRLPGLA